MRKNIRIRNGVYYWREMIRGTRYDESTGVRVGGQAAERQALTVAKEKRRAVLDRDVHRLAATRVQQGYASIGAVIEHFRAVAAKRDMAHNSVRQYVKSLGRVLLQGGGIRSIEDQSTTILSVGLVDRYEIAALAEVSSANPGAQRRRRNTIASTLNQARALFSAWARVKYEQAGLRLPDLTGFLRAGDVMRDVSWDLPSADLVSHTKAQASKLRDQDKDLWTVWILCYGLAMRSDEAAHARWDWIYDVRGQRSIDIIKRPAEWSGPKGTEGHVPISDDMWSALCAVRGDSTYILPGETITARRNLVGRRFAKWIRECGWDKDTYIHCAHEMRRLRGSEWWTEPSIGPVVCSAWLRHSSLAVTQQHYAKLTVMPAPLGL